MTQNHAVANRIKEMCELKNMTLAELSENSGIPYKSLYRLAHAVHANPSLFVIMRICDALGITVDEFISSPDFKEFRLPWEG